MLALSTSLLLNFMFHSVKNYATKINIYKLNKLKAWGVWIVCAFVSSEWGFLFYFLYATLRCAFHIEHFGFNDKQDLESCPSRAAFTYL